ncbi:MAG: glycerol kinase GlpK [Bacteroidales bacterium]
MKKFILSVDQSTSATKAILFNNDAKLVARADKEHKQYYPQSGWVEHDPEEIYRNTCHVIKEVVEKAGIPFEEIACLSVTNQRETVVVWDRQTGKPVYNAIVWQCQRGAEICRQLEKEGYREMIKKKTGLIIDPYFSASGIKWILGNVEGVKEKAGRGEIACGTIDSWLIYNLTNGRVHATDHSNACRTMLYNIHNLDWDKEILDLLDIPMSMMPEVKPSNAFFGEVECREAFPVNLPVTGVMGDSHAALFGQLCLEPGLGKATYGTGSSVMMNIGKKPQDAPDGLVTSIGFSFNDEVDYVFEGNIHCTGDTVKWLVDNLKLLERSKESEALATSVPDNGGVYFVPGFAGLGAPYWNNKARALITGMDRGARKEHVVRAALEAIAFQIKDVIDRMTRKSGIALQELRVDGGPTGNSFLMQFQADMLDSTIHISNIEEASALGVALMGGITSSIWENFDDLNNTRAVGKKVSPQMKEEQRKKLYMEWQQAVKKTLLNI